MSPDHVPPEPLMTYGPHSDERATEVTDLLSCQQDKGPGAIYFSMDGNACGKSLETRRIYDGSSMEATRDE